VRHRLRVASFGDGDVVSESRSAERIETDLGHLVFRDADVRGDAGGGIELNLVALAVVEGECVAGVPFAAGERQAGGGIEAAAYEADRFRGRMRGHTLLYGHPPVPLDLAM
jgi:hypothetical protein